MLYIITKLNHIHFVVKLVKMLLKLGAAALSENGKLKVRGNPPEVDDIYSLQPIEGVRWLCGRSDGGGELFSVSVSLQHKQAPISLFTLLLFCFTTQHFLFPGHMSN